MKFATIVVLSFVVGLAIGSIFPEDEQEWKRKNQESIDKLRKSDVTIRVKVDSERKDAHDVCLMVNQTRASFPMGTALVAWRIAQCLNNNNDDGYCSFAKNNFNFAVAENAMKWRDYEPNENQYNRDNPDKLIQWAQNHGLRMRGHCLFWDVDDYSHYPDWVHNLRGQDMVDAIHHRLNDAVSHFRGKVEHWDVNNEMLHGNFFTQATGDNDIRVKMFQWANQIDGGIKWFVNDYSVLLWESDGYVSQIQDLLNRGAPITGIGIQGHLGPSQIDIGKVQNSLDKLWNQFHIPIWITEFDWEASNGNHAQHAIELENFYNTVMGHPGVEGILMWGFWDQAHWRPNAAIVEGSNFTPNEAGEKYMQLYHNSYRTNEIVEPEVSEDGTELTYKFRAFRGNFEVNAVDKSGNIIAQIEKDLAVEDNTVFKCVNCI